MVLAELLLLTGVFIWLWGLRQWCKEIETKVESIGKPTNVSSVSQIIDFEPPTKVTNRKVKTADDNAIKKDKAIEEKGPKFYQ